MSLACCCLEQELKLFSSASDHPFLVLLRLHGKQDEALAAARGQLTELILSGCELGDSGAQIFAEFLKEDKMVTRAVLYRCSIGLLGAKAIAEALKVNRTLEFLSLNSNWFRPGGGEALIDALTNYNINLTQLWVSGLQSESRAVIKHLTETRNAKLIPAARRAALFLIGIRQSSNFDGMGCLGMIDKNVVKMIAILVWDTREDPKWLNADKEEHKKCCIA